MAVDIEQIGIDVDTRGVVKGQKELDKLGTSADKASKQADNLSKSTTNVGKSTSAFSSVAAGAIRVLGALTTAFVALNSAKALAGSIDSYTKLNAQLKLATKTQDDYNQALSNVKRIATTAQSDLSAIATLYARLSNSLSELGVEQKKISVLSETVALGLKVAGASAGESSSVMLQLSQAFSAGALRGDEFNSMAENAPSLMRALAKSMGITTGELRSMAEQGAITREVLLKAFGDEELLKGLRAQAKETNTISGAWQNVTNAITLAIGELDKLINMSGALKGFLNIVATAIGPVQEGSLLDKKRKAELASLNKLPTSRLKTMSNFGGYYKEAYDLRVAQEAANGNKLGGATAITSSGSFAPNFSVTRKDGQGGYDARENNTKQLEDQRKLRDEQLKLAKELADKKRKLEEDDFDFQMSLINTWNKLENKQQEEALKEKKEREEAYMKWQQDIANENFKAAQDANKKLEDDRRKEAEKTVDAIDNIFREGFANLTNGGLKSWKAFTKSLFTTFKTTVADQIYKLFAQPFVVKLVASVLGIGGSGSALASVAGSGSSASSIFGGIKDIFSNINSSFQSSIESFGSYISDYFPKLGGAIGQYSSSIAAIAPYAGAALQLLGGNIKGAAFNAAGVALGSAIGGPIGGAIGGVLGSVVGGLFGGKKIPRYSSQSITNYKDGQFSTSSGTPMYKSLGATSQTTGLNEAFINTILPLFNAYGITDSIDAKTRVVQKRKSSYAEFWAGTNGGMPLLEGVKGSAKSTQQTFEQLVEKVLSTGVSKFIKSSSLPEGIKKFFDSLTTKEDVADAISTLVSLKDQLKDLPDVFNAVRDAIDTTAYSMSIEQLKKVFNDTSTFVNLFYSDSEKFDIYTKQIITQLDALNVTLPTSRDRYRALVDSINVVDEATQSQFAGLVALAPAMNEYFNLLQQQKDGIDGVNASLRGSENFSNLIDFQRYQGLAQNYGGAVANGATFGTNNEAVIIELRALNLEIGRLNEKMDANNKTSKKTADLLTSVTEDGQALLTTAA